MKKLPIVCALLLFRTVPAAGHSNEECEGSKQNKGACEHPKAPPALNGNQKKWDGSVLVRGEKIKGAPTATLTSILKSPETSNGKELIVEGTVRRACERRGCWMELAEGKNGPGIRVTFKDYGFFVPRDSAGARAKVAGTLKVVELSPELVSHYESEGANVSKDATGKARDIQLVATGVELRR